MATTPSEIQSLYVAYFNRPAEPAGLQFWLERANARGGADFVANEFSNSNEYRDLYAGKSNAEIVDAIYMNLFGRHAEQAGKDYWALKLDRGELNIGNVARIISTSAQNDDLVAINNKLTAATMFTASLSNGEVAGYDGPAANAVVRAWLTGISTTAQLLAGTTNAVMDSVAAAAAEARALANAIVVNLTANADQLTGGAASEKFTGDGSTFSNGDTLNGGAGIDSLVVTATGALNTEGRSLSNVELISLRSSAGITADSTGWTGVTSLSVAGAGGAVSLTASDTTAVAATDVTGSGAISIQGGKSVALSAINTTGALTIAGSAISSVNLSNVAVDGAASITDTSAGRNVLTKVVVDKLDAQSGLHISGDAMTNIEVSNAGAGSTLRLENHDFRGYTLNVTLNATKRFEIEDERDNAATVAFTLNGDSAVDLSAGAAQNISVAGTGQLSLYEGIGSNIANIRQVQLTGAAGIKAELGTMDKFAVFDASASTGNNDITLAAIQPGLIVKGGAGTDKVLIDGALGATASVALGGGNDYLFINAAPTAGAKIEGGAGSDTLALSNSGLLAADRFSGFEILEVANGQGIYDLDLLAGVTHVRMTEDEASGNLTIQDAVAGIALDIAANDSSTMNVTGELAIKLKSDGTANSINVGLTADDGNDDGVIQGTVKLSKLLMNDMETINLASNVDELDADKSGTSANEATVATSYVNEISLLDSDDLKVLNLSGNASLKIANFDAGNLTKIDASKMTGKLTVNTTLVPKGIEFIGGSAGDTYFASELAGLITGGGGADAITLDASKSSVDKLRFGAGDSRLTAKVDGHDKISNFSSFIVYDLIDLTAFGFTGSRSAAVLNKGSLGASTVDGSTLVQANFFADGATDRAVAYGVRASSTFVFVDVNKDGDFTAAADLYIEVVGATGVALQNFVFG